LVLVILVVLELVGVGLVWVGLTSEGSGGVEGEEGSLDGLRVVLWNLWRG